MSGKQKENGGLRRSGNENNRNSTDRGHMAPEGVGSVTGWSTGALSLSPTAMQDLRQGSDFFGTYLAHL